jgi:hypothetical protein
VAFRCAGSSLRVDETWEAAIAGYATLLRDHVTLTCRSVDRILLQAYVPRLQSVGMVCQFLCWQRGFPIPSSAAFGKISEAFAAEVHKFAKVNGIPVRHFVKGEKNEEVARSYVCPRRGYLESTPGWPRLPCSALLTAARCSTCSEALVEGQKRVGRPVSAGFHPEGCRPRDRLFLERRVGVLVNMRGLGAEKCPSHRAMVAMSTPLARKSMALV